MSEVPLHTVESFCWSAFKATARLMISLRKSFDIKKVTGNEVYYTA